MKYLIILALTLHIAYAAPTPGNNSTIPPKIDENTTIFEGILPIKDESTTITPEVDDRATDLPKGEEGDASIISLNDETTTIVPEEDDNNISFSIHDETTTIFPDFDDNIILSINDESTTIYPEVDDSTTILPERHDSAITKIFLTNDVKAPILKSNSLVEPIEIAYGYETDNGIIAHAVIMTDKDEDKTLVAVQGSYGYGTPDGSNVIINYTADEKGYRPVVSYKIRALKPNSTPIAIIKDTEEFLE